LLLIDRHLIVSLVILNDGRTSIRISSRISGYFYVCSVCRRSVVSRCTAGVFRWFRVGSVRVQRPVWWTVVAHVVVVVVFFIRTWNVVQILRHKMARLDLLCTKNGTNPTAVSGREQRFSL
jgi:hypothetical protein